MPTQHPFSLDGRTALIAGASRGIGLAIAGAIARAGAHTILASRSMPALESNAVRLRSEGCKAEARRLDIASGESIRSLVQDLPAIDILVNVSGTNIRKAVEKYSPTEYETIMQTNLHGIFDLTQSIGSRMIARGKGGKVISIGSMTSLLGLPYLTVYAMTKSGLAGMTRVLAAEWGRHNIQVNVIAPGFIITDLNREMWKSEVMLNWLRGAQANPRIGVPEDIAPLAVLLAGPGSDYITGQVIAVDGGYSTTANWPYLPPQDS